MEILRNNTHLSITVKTNLFGKYFCKLLKKDFIYLFLEREEGREKERERNIGWLPLARAPAGDLA